MPDGVVVLASSSGAPLRVAIIVSRFHSDVTQGLLDGAVRALREAGADQIAVAFVPGAFELPATARRLAESGRYDALVCLGAVIRGETLHFEYVCKAVTDGLARLAYEAPIPVSFGVLTTATLAQAQARAGDEGGNKGAEAAWAAVDVVALWRGMDMDI